MTRPLARRVIVGLIAAFAVAVHWPGVLLANRVGRRILGLPFPLLWVALWIVIGFVVLLVVDHGLYGGRDRRP